MNGFGGPWPLPLPLGFQNCAGVAAAPATSVAGGVEGVLVVGLLINDVVQNSLVDGVGARDSWR